MFVAYGVTTTMADTDITLSVDLDVADAEKTAEQLHKEINDIFKSRNGEQSAQLTQLEIQMKKNVLRAQELREKLNELGKTKVATDYYKQISDDFEKVSAEFFKLQTRMKNFEESGGDVTSDKYHKWAIEIEHLGDDYDYAIKKKKELEESGKAYIAGTETEQYRRMNAELDATNDKLKQQLIRHQQIVDKEDEQAGRQQQVRTHVTKTTQSAHLLRNAFERIRRSAGKATTSMSSGLKNANGMLKKGIRTLLMYGLGIRGLFSLIQKLRTALKEGFQNLLNSDMGSGLKKQVDDLKASFTNLKNAFAAAFEPVLRAVIPYLQKLADWLTVVVDKLGQFIALLHGQNTYIKTIKKAGQTAKEAGENAESGLAGFDKLNNLTSTKGSGDGSGAGSDFVNAPISDAMKKFLDDLKKMWDEADFSELGRTINKKLTEMLKKIDWDKIEALGTKIGKCIATGLNGFFEGLELAKELGEGIARALNTAFNFIGGFAKNFNWSQFGEFIKTGINSFLDNAKTYDWGFNVGSIVRGLIESIYTVVSDGEMWANLGNKIAEGLNGAIDSMFQTTKVFKGFGMNHVPIYEELNGFQLAADAFSDFAKGLIESLTTAVKNTDWHSFAEGVAEWIATVDWSGIAFDLVDLALEIVNALIEALHTMDDKLYEEGEKMYESGEKLGGSFLMGVASGINLLKVTGGPAIDSHFNEGLNVLRSKLTGESVDLGEDTVQGYIDGVEKRAQENDSKWLAIWGKFISVVANLFQIHSPSKVFEGFANDIMAGFMNPLATLTTLWSNLWNSIANALQGPINTIISAVSSLVDSIMGMFNSAIEAFNNFTGSIGSGISSIGSSVVSHISSKTGGRIRGAAGGAVIPPTAREHFIMVGDNDRESEIVSPLSTIEQALRNVMTEQNINITFDVQGDPEGIFNVVRKQSDAFTKRTGLGWT